MELNILEESKTKLIVEIKGEDATLCNILRKELWNDDSVKAAAFAIAHPSATAPQLIVETSGKAPRDVILEAVSRVRKNLSEFDKAAAKVL